MILVFLIFSFKLALSPSSFTLIKRLFSLSAIRVISSTYLRLLMFLPPILILTCNLSSPASLMMCSAYRLNQQGDSRQLCWTPCSILNQSVVPYRVLTAVSWPAYRFLRRQVRWSGISVSFHSSFHSLLWSTQRLWHIRWKKVDVFLEFSTFLYDSADVDNLISDSSSFSKPNLDI